MVWLELDDEPRSSVISEFLEQELARMEEHGFEKLVQRCSAAKLDELLQNMVRKNRKRLSKIAEWIKWIC